MPTSQVIPCALVVRPLWLKMGFHLISFRQLDDGHHKLSKFTSEKTLSFSKLCCSGEPLTILFNSSFLDSSTFVFTSEIASRLPHLIGFHSRSKVDSVKFNILEPTFSFH